MTDTAACTLFASWALHDIEEIIAFPTTSALLAERTGVTSLRMSLRQSVVAVGGMGLLIGCASVHGHRTRGRSRLYRAVVAGLDAHIVTHLGASLVLRRYTAGLATAVPVMGYGTVVAKRDLHSKGLDLSPRDYVRGAAILLPAAIACHALARAFGALR